MILLIWLLFIYCINNMKLYVLIIWNKNKYNSNIKIYKVIKST